MSLTPSAFLAADTRLEALTRISAAQAGAPSLMALLPAALGPVREATGAASASVSRWDRDRGQVRVLVNAGTLGPGEAPFPTDEMYRVTEFPAVDRMFALAEPFVARRGAGDDAGVEALLRQLDKQSCIGVPLVVEGRVWGELFLARGTDQPAYTEADLPFAVAAAALLAAGVAQVTHFERVARLAYSDPLTGLANRRAIDDRLDEAFARRAVDGSAVSLVVCDINGLKQINDDRGHEAGDRALVHFAGLLAAAAGLVPGSLAGRTGGDEFAVVVEGGGADHAVWVAEDICRRAAVAMDGGVAVGVASTHDPVGPVDGPARLFRLADAAQTRAKRSRSRSPVVAGRGLPDDATLWLAGVDDAPGTGQARMDRRRVRRSARDVAARVFDSVLETLDHGPGCDELARLEVVADATARLVDAAGWWVSVVDPGADVLRTVSFSAIRLAAQAAAADPYSDVGATFALGDYPSTAGVLQGGGLYLAVADPWVDPMELAVLDAGGYKGLVMAGGRDRAGTCWLVEVYLDEISAPVEALPPVLRGLVACALLGAG